MILKVCLQAVNTASVTILGVNAITLFSNIIARQTIVAAFWENVDPVFRVIATSLAIMASIFHVHHTYHKRKLERRKQRIEIERLEREFQKTQ